MILALIGEIRDELRRAYKDWETNKRQIRVLKIDKQGKVTLKTKKAGNLRVGDIIFLKD